MSTKKSSYQGDAPTKILVTGGAGYIGSHAVVELYQSGFQPVIVDNFSKSDPDVLKRLRKLTGEEIPFYQQDCCDKEGMNRIFEQEKDIRGVIHFAAFKSVAESVQKPLKYYNNNINSLLVLLEVMQEHAVTDLVFSSTCAVYGESDHFPVTESSPLGKAVSPYAETKQICENIIRDHIASDGTVRALVLRYFNPIGAHPSGLIGEQPAEKPENLMPYITQSAAGLRSGFTIFGNDYDTPDGTCIRDYIHVVDLAKAHIHAISWLEKQISPRFTEVFNVGTGAGYSVLEIVRAFENLLDEPMKYEIGSRRAGDIGAIYAEVDKAQEILGWKAQKSLSEALRDAWNWQQQVLKP